ncbi:MAG: hypothetical protein DRP58_12775 [Spirochaetes bacterium]|nr:MAG: hypothetical protein DRP58_12775 [Spirochaetota bacterium]
MKINNLKINKMKNLLKKVILTGIGIGLMTKDKVEEFAKKTAEEAKMTEEEARKFADEVLKQSEDSKQKIEEMIDKQVKKSIDKLGLANKEDLEKIEKKLSKLQSTLNKKANFKE